MSRSKIPKATRERVRERAGGRCEYCRKPEGISRFAHHVDHIRAVKHGGSSDDDNLAWACFQCNVTKGSNIASYDDETKRLTPLYNPRTQSWGDHFRMEGGLILGRTPFGRVTVKTLQINHPEQVMTRLNLMETDLWHGD